MSRIRIPRLVWLGLLLVAALIAGCSGNAPAPTTPTPTPAPTVGAVTGSSAEQTVQIMTPVVRAFLSTLPKDWNLIAPQDVATKKPFIVDVRQPEEYKQGFVQGAVNIPLRDLVRNLQALPSLNQDIVVVCSTGHRSAIGMAILQMLGYSKAKSMTGGMQAWTAAKLPMVTQPAPQRAAGPVPQVDANVKGALDYYLTNMLPDTWGLIDSVGLVQDQAQKSSTELEAQPAIYSQGASILADVDEPAEFAKTTIDKAINVPLSGMPDNLTKLPVQTVTLYP